MLKKICKSFWVGTDLMVLKIFIYDVGVKREVIFHNFLITSLVTTIIAGVAFIDLIDYLRGN